MAGKSRSKSPKGKKGGGGFSLDDPNVATLVNAGVCVGLCFALGGGFQDQNSLTNFFFGDNAIPFWPFGNFVLTMHCLNTCSGVGSGKFWVNAFVQAYFVRRQRIKSKCKKQNSGRPAHPHTHTRTHTHAHTLVTN